MPADTAAKRDKLRAELLAAAIYHAKASKRGVGDYGDFIVRDHANAAATLVAALVQADTI